MAVSEQRWWIESISRDHKIHRRSIRRSSTTELPQVGDVDALALGLVQKVGPHPFGERAGAGQREVRVSEPPDPVSRRRYAALGVRLFLAAIRDRPVGYASLLARDHMGYIGDLYTAPEVRKRGVGSTLVLDLLEASQAAGNAFTSLTTAWTNTAQELYRKLGFIAVGERRGFERALPR